MHGGSLTDDEFNKTKRSIDISYCQYVIVGLRRQLTLCDNHYKMLVYNRVCVQCTRVLTSSHRMYYMSGHLRFIPSICREVNAELDFICDTCRYELNKLAPIQQPLPFLPLSSTEITPIASSSSSSHSIFARALLSLSLFNNHAKLPIARCSPAIFLMPFSI